MKAPTSLTLSQMSTVYSRSSTTLFSGEFSEVSQYAISTPFTNPEPGTLLMEMAGSAGMSMGMKFVADDTGTGAVSDNETLSWSEHYGILNSNEDFDISLHGM
jgi:hypothetical protein